MIADQIVLALIFFFSILRWIVLIDVLLSWSVLFGFRIRIPFIRGILDPLYVLIRRYLPTSFSGLDFAPVVLLLIIMLFEGMLIQYNPAVTVLF